MCDLTFYSSVYIFILQSLEIGRVQITRDAYRTEFLNASIDAADHEALEIIEIK